jgi:MHS family proline/betaine transporter-like MFS transporter
VFAIGYFARPIGGLLYGHLGDRIGRKRTLQISVIAMAVPTTLISVLPTDAHIGAWAAVLLIVLRLAQGISVGGEFIGSICYIVEVAPSGKRSFYGSFSVFSTVAGMLLGSGVAAIIHFFMTDATITEWGWRLPFLGGVVLGVFGWTLRRRLLETPAFQETLEQGRTVAHPGLEAMRQMPVQVLQVTVLIIIMAICINTLFLWMPTYLMRLVQPPVTQALLINTFAMVPLIAVMPLAGMLADRLGFKPVLAVAMIAIAILVYPMFIWLDTGAVAMVIAAQLVLAVINGSLQGPIPIAMAAQFPVHIRYSAMAVAYNGAFALFGGTAPIMATWMIKETGNLTVPAWYIAAAGIFSLVALLSLTGRYAKSDKP